MTPVTFRRIIVRSSTNHLFRAYPAAMLAGCFGIGIAAAAYWPKLTLEVWVLVAGSACMAAGWAVFMRARRVVGLRQLTWSLGLVVLVVAVGGLRQSTSGYLDDDHVAHLLYRPEWDDQQMWVEGRVSSDAVGDSTQRRFTFAVRRLIHQDTVLVQGNVRVTVEGMSGASESMLAPGMVLSIYGMLRPLPLRRNPADFDYGRYLLRRDVHALMTVQAADVRLLNRQLGVVDAVLGAMRRYVRRHLDTLVAGAEARAVLSALTLGERHHVDDALRERFVRTGLMHLLAVSGLHVLVVGMVVYQLLRPFLLRLGWRWSMVEWTRSGCTLLLLTSYMLLTGAPASVIRAVVMAAVGLGSVLLQRKTNALNVLGVAACILLAVRPAHLFEPGFQLSFSAVTALVLLVPSLQQWMPAWTRRNAALRYVSSSVLASLAATLGTAPVLLFHFGHTSFAGLLLNVAAIPLTLLGLGAVLVAVALAGVAPAVAVLPAAAAEACIEMLLWIARMGDDWLSWSALQGHVTDWAVVLTVAAALLTLAAWHYPRRRWWLAACLLVNLNLCLWLGPSSDSSGSVLDVIFFDVGHGDAALLTLPNGRHVLIDTGGRSHYVDYGRRTLLPHLTRYGIRELDLVIVTHPDSDHLGGLPSLLRGVAVDRVVHNGRLHDSQLFSESMMLLDSLDVVHRSVSAGDTLDIDPSVRIQVLAPLAGTDEKSNEASIVVKVIHGSTHWLFTGDVEARGEMLLTSRFGHLLRSSVVKVPHHGSSTSSTPALVRAVASDARDGPIAVVSVSRSRRFGLPDEDVLTRWQEYGASVFTTGSEGAVWLRSDGNTIEHVDWRY